MLDDYARLRGMLAADALSRGRTCAADGCDLPPAGKWARVGLRDVCCVRCHERRLGLRAASRVTGERGEPVELLSHTGACHRRAREAEAARPRPGLP